MGYVKGLTTLGSSSHPDKLQPSSAGVPSSARPLTAACVHLAAKLLGGVELSLVRIPTELLYADCGRVAQSYSASAGDLIDTADIVCWLGTLVCKQHR